MTLPSKGPRADRVGMRADLASRRAERAGMRAPRWATGLCLTIALPMAIGAQLRAQPQTQAKTQLQTQSQVHLRTPSPTPAQSSPTRYTHSAAEASLLAADRSAATGAAALSAALSDDATVLLDDQNILRTRAQWTPHLTAMFSADEGPAWIPIHAVMSRDGSLGCTTGVLRYAPMSVAAPQTGRYAACWRREANGWRMVALSRSNAPAQVKHLPDSLPGAPASAQVAPKLARDAARAMADADRAFAKFSIDSGGPGGAFAKWIAVDGMMLGARAVPVRGREAARAAFAGFPATGRFEWGPIDALTVASRDGSLGFTIGEARIAATPQSVSYSKYLTIWRYEGDEGYRFVFDIGSDRPAP